MNASGILRPIVVLVLLLLFVLPASAQEAELSLDQAAATITASELKQHLTYIASDELGGRDTGSEGCRKAAAYIRKELDENGLAPMGDVAEDGRSFFQRVTVPGGAKLEKDGNQLVLKADANETAFAVKKQFTPLAESGSSTVQDAALVFVGYGITDADAGYDDYVGLDVKGKVAAMFRYEPKESSAKNYRPGPGAALVAKMSNAVKHGAIGVIIVNGPNSRTAGKADALIGLRQIGRYSGKRVPVVHAKREFLDALFGGRKNVAALQKTMDTTKVPQGKPIAGVTVTLGVRIKREKIRSQNVVALIEGRDPKLKNEVIVVGAHYDHIGLGRFGSRWGKKGAGKIHNGANDNGSGTVTLLEVAEAVAALKERPRRSIAFVFFTGEERGLHGSRHFANYPAVPDGRLVAMINADMVGQPGKKPRATINGAGTSSVFKAIIKKASVDPRLTIRTVDSGYAPSDNISFLRKGIPVLFYFTGFDKYYHTPKDDAEFIQFDGMRVVAQHIMRNAVGVANHPGTIDFVKVKPKRRGIKLGIYPDAEKLPAVVAAAVVRGSPAQKAGMLKGDRIVELAGQKIKSLMNLSQILGKQKRGGKVSLKVIRTASDGAEKALTLSIQF
jgi:peptidase M28-like protein/PDZ domain-containing protein/PA domain-containing protein